MGFQVTKHSLPTNHQQTVTIHYIKLDAARGNTTYTSFQRNTSFPGGEVTNTIFCVPTDT